MGDGENPHRKREADGLLAGLEAGIIAALVLLGWLALASAWYRRSIWTAANIMATTFYGDARSDGLLAGLEAGIIAALVLLGWLALASAWYRRSIWTAANIMATTFYGDAALGDRKSVV